jgi:hypothetical protein
VGAALHLAHAQQAPPGPQRKRKGGGGSGDRYDAMVRRIYSDDRQTPESRELLLLLAWIILREPSTPETQPRGWNRVNRILGFDTTQTPRLARLLNEDRPRYEPDRKHSAWSDQTCSAPMIRRTGPCGQPSHDHSFRIDPETGWHTPVWYCRRHRDTYGRDLDNLLRQTERPEPIPNTGGLLPSYLNHRDGDAGWTKLYEWASGWCYSRWKPPTKYGLRADDWPRPDRPAKTASPEPVRLRLIAFDGELVQP